MKEILASPSTKSAGYVPSVPDGATHGRMAWLDVARGLGILLVVLGHLHNGVMGRVIYAFHMPYFFFLSGFIHKTQPNYASFFRKRAIHLLVPYLSFLLLLAPLEFHHASHGGQRAIARLTFDILWGGDRLKGDYGVFWFITCLFATQQIANWVLSRFTSRQVATIASFSMCLGYANSILLPRFSLPLDLNVVACALFFYLAGYFSKNVDLGRDWIICVAFVGVAVTIRLSYMNLPVFYDMRSAYYGVPVLSLALAGCCTVVLIWLSKVIVRSPLVAKMMGNIGAASMGIMFIHKPLPAVPALGRIALQYPNIAFVVFTSIAYVCTILLARSKIGRALFLGSYNDFQTLRAS